MDVTPPMRSLTKMSEVPLPELVRSELRSPNNALQAASAAALIRELNRGVRDASQNVAFRFPLVACQRAPEVHGGIDHRLPPQSSEGLSDDAVVLLSRDFRSLVHHVREHYLSAVNARTWSGSGLKSRRGSFSVVQRPRSHTLVRPLTRWRGYLRDRRRLDRRRWRQSTRHRTLHAPHRIGNRRVLSPRA